MKRYIAKFSRGGFPDLYEVLDTEAGFVIGEPKPYHEANDEAGARNDGTWGKPAPEPELVEFQFSPSAIYQMTP